MSVADFKKVFPALRNLTKPPMTRDYWMGKRFYIQQSTLVSRMEKSECCYLENIQELSRLYQTPSGIKTVNLMATGEFLETLARLDITPQFLIDSPQYLTKRGEGNPKADQSALPQMLSAATASKDPKKIMEYLEAAVKFTERDFEVHSTFLRLMNTPAMVTAHSFQRTLGFVTAKDTDVMVFTNFPDPFLYKLDTVGFLTHFRSQFVVKEFEKLKQGNNLIDSQLVQVLQLLQMQTNPRFPKIDVNQIIRWIKENERKKIDFFQVVSRILPKEAMDTLINDNKIIFHSQNLKVTDLPPIPVADEADFEKKIKALIPDLQVEVLRRLVRSFSRVRDERRKHPLRPAPPLPQPVEKKKPEKLEQEGSATATEGESATPGEGQQPTPTEGKTS